MTNLFVHPLDILSGEGEERIRLHHAWLPTEHCNTISIRRNIQFNSTWLVDEHLFIKTRQTARQPPHTCVLTEINFGAPLREGDFRAGAVGRRTSGHVTGFAYRETDVTVVE
jgi:hypothetical protein